MTEQEHVEKYSAFVSHASEDSEMANEIVGHLEAKGFRCWIAPRNVRVGQKYGKEIIRGIRQSNCLILLLTETSNQSTFVEHEVERAISYGKPVFTVRVEDLPPSPELELFVSATHWIDAWKGQWVDHLQQLVQDMMVQEKEGSAPIPKELQRIATQRVNRRERFRALVWPLVAGVSVIGIITIAMLALLREPPPTVTQYPTPEDGAQAQQQYEAQLLQQSENIGTSEIIPTVAYSSGKWRVNLQFPDALWTTAISMLYAVNDEEYVNAGKPGNLQLQNAAHVKKLRIKFHLQNQKEIGPFEYKLDLAQEARKNLKQEAAEGREWMSCSDYQCRISIRSIAPALQAIEYGSSPDELSCRLPVEVPDEALNAGAYRSTNGHVQYIPFFNLVPEIHARLVFYDGDVGPTRKISIMRNQASDGILLKPDPEQKGEHFELAGGTHCMNLWAKTSFQYRWSLEPLYSQQAEKTYYSWDGKAFAAVQNREIGISKTDAENKRIWLKFQLANGDIVGPVAYRIRFMEAYYNWLRQNLGNFSPLYCNKRDNGCRLYNATAFNGIRQIRYGTTAGNLKTLTVDRTSEQHILAGNADQSPYEQNDANRILFALPAGTDELLYVQYVLLNNEVLDVLPLPVHAY